MPSPDQPGHPDYPREEWVGLDKDAQSKAQSQDAGKGADNVDTDQTGDYLNYEVSVSYQALPRPVLQTALPQHPSDARVLRRRFVRVPPLHYCVRLVLMGVVDCSDWFKIPIPIYAIVEGFVATVRMRVQFVQQPPFVRNLTVTLIGVPKVEVSVEPFTKKLPNVLDLPLIKKFVEMGIAAAVRVLFTPCVMMEWLTVGCSSVRNTSRRRA